MATLVFDIETVGESWEGLDAATRTTLTRWIDRSTHSEEQRAAYIRDVREGLGFSPLTGHIVSLALFDREREEGTVYYQAEDRSASGSVNGYRSKVRSERELLTEFWDGARQYDVFVTFNGRGFDVPFLLHRSVVCGVCPTLDLMSKRYLLQQQPPYHVDLQDELTFYGAMQRRPSLHLFCRAYGIESPKVGGVAGDDVAELFHLKKFRDIARYNAADVTATTALYDTWLKYLAPPEFLNRIT